MFKSIWNHLQSWAEGYLWVPIALLVIPAAALYVYFLTGRPPEEGADWIMSTAYRFMDCIFIVLLISITREQTGFWLTKEEALAASPKMVPLIQGLVKCFFAGLFCYILLH